jgi:NADH-quinone oxidoreductase subunit N
MLFGLALITAARATSYAAYGGLSIPSRSGLTVVAWCSSPSASASRSAVPFGWAPDVYQGAPTPVTAFMSVGVKAGAFVGFSLSVFVPPGGTSGQRPDILPCSRW